MDSLRRRGGPLRVGVIGMGVGAMAAYGRAGDSFRFYELDPAVAALARGKDALFSLLDDSPATVDVVVGDGRLSLDRELAATGPNRFDLCVVDAFSSDAVPAHLFTVEALELYLTHLDADGLLLFHLTNRHLDLRGVALAAAERLGLAAVVIESQPSDELLLPSKWVLVARDRALLADDPLVAAASLVAPVPEQRPWTDSYSDLVGALLARRRAGAG